MWVSHYLSHNYMYMASYPAPVMLKFAKEQSLEGRGCDLRQYKGALSALNLLNPGCLALWFLWKSQDFLVTREQKLGVMGHKVRCQRTAMKGFQDPQFEWNPEWDLGKHHDKKQNFTATQAAGFEKICAQIQDDQSHTVHFMSCFFTMLRHENY